MIRGKTKLPKDVQARIPKLVEPLFVDQDVIALYSFGSLVKKDLKPLSDLDFGLLLSQKLDRSRHLEIHLELIGLFTETLKTDEIDLILMNYAPDNIGFQILQTGHLLVCNDRNLLIDYRERLLLRYLDFKPIREAFDSAFLKGIGYHG